jgi:membrane protein required for colicin V production
MLGVDFAILGILVISTFISLLRGFVREAMSLAGWILAFWVSLTFASGLSDLLTSSFEDPTFRLIAAFVGLFVLSLIVSSIVNFFAVKLVHRTGLTKMDRFLGVLFGFGRGLLIVTILVLLAGLTTLPREPWWHESFLLFRFQAVAEWIQALLPAGIAGSFHY